jgi:hypothetical protein
MQSDVKELMKEQRIPDRYSISSYKEPLIKINKYEIGISNVNVLGIDRLAHIIDRYFQVFENKYLKDSILFLEIVKGYINHSCENKLAIYISNAFVTWVFCTYMTKIERVPLIKNHKLTIYTNTGIIDKNKAITSFASIFTHSIDAHIVFLFESIIKEIELALVKRGIKFNIGTFTNHDNFGIIMEFAIYLSIIIKDQYNTISKLNYIKQLDNPIVKKLLAEILNRVNLICENENFIKH